MRLRYRGEDTTAVLEVEAEKLRVEFRTPQRAVAPGQSVVVYRGDDLIGGARILRRLL